MDELALFFFLFLLTGIILKKIETEEPGEKNKEVKNHK